MMRTFLLWLSRQSWIFRFVRHNRLAKGFASRFVAGETIASAVDAVRALNAAGIAATLDLLGESVTNEAEARAAGREYLAIFDAIHTHALDANASLKLTQMGQDISEALCEAIVGEILARAQATGSFLRLDMESSAYTEKTLALFERAFFPRHGAQVGIVLQSALRRTRADVEHAIALQCRVRLCKGAYLEPAAVAFPDKKDVDANYVACAEQLLSRGNYPGIATHDPKMIAAVQQYATAHGIARDRFEFQMLYGVRRDLQEQLVREGWRLRVYVPFGTQWYPYLMRRLAERPANVWFIAGNILREGRTRRRLSS